MSEEKELTYKEKADLAVEIAAMIKKGGDDQRGILDIVISLVAPDWRLVYGRD